MKVLVFMVLAIIMMSAVVHGVDVSLEKTLSGRVITDGDVVTVKITLVNNLDKEIKGEIKDSYPKFAGIEGYTEKRDYVSMSPTLNWNITLKPKEKREITYYLNFSSIPITLNDENYTIPGVSFHYGKYAHHLKGTDIYLTGLSVPEKGCNYNFVCEPERDENFGNCPQDCSSSGKDNYCNPIKNVVCDPDCSRGEDADCEYADSGEAGKAGKGYSIYYIILAIVIMSLVLFIAYRKIQEKKKWEELERKYTNSHNSHP